MRLICKKKLLSEKIGLVARTASGKTSLPILECILLTADDSGLHLAASDLEMGIETDAIEAEIFEEGSVALDSDVFKSIINKLPGDDVEIVVDESNMTTIRSMRSEFKILGHPGAEFPKIQAIERDNPCIIPAAELRNLIRQTIFSIATDDSKPVLSGELMEVSEGFIKLVSVDGFRISLRQHVNSDLKNADISIKAVIPGKTLGEIAKILPSYGDMDIAMFFSDKHVLFDLKNCIITSRLIEGEFIKYEHMFTKDYTTLINVDRVEFLEVIERATLISKDARKNPVKLKLDDNRLVITSNSELGNSYEEMGVTQDGQNLEIGFNPRFLTDILKNIDNNAIAMQFTTSLSPCIIKVEDSEDYKYLVLPRRL